LRWCGYLLIGIWAVLLVWTFRNLGKNLTDTVVTRKEHSLVTTGPYRYVRHPFYLAFFLAALGGSMVAANWFLLIAGLVPAIFLIARTRIEEEQLVERFGEEYSDYMKITGRFLPTFFK
jgi:protein-S-isoprenylcysteine O-methyltransferase Ste14